MFPTGENFNHNPHSSIQFSYSPYFNFFNIYPPWIPQLNFIPQNTNFSHEIYNEGQGVTKDTVKSLFQKTTAQEKSQNYNITKSQSVSFRTYNDSINHKCHEQQFNQIDQEESSFNSNKKKKKNNQKNKKPKKGPQNKNRNIVPSIIQQIFSFLCKPTKSKEICQRVFSLICKPVQVELTITRYYNYIKLVKQKQNHYVNQKTLKILNTTQQIGINIFCQQQQKFYLKVARILAQHFLLKVSPLLTLHSKRIAHEKKIDHLRISRVLLQIVSQLQC